MIEMETFEIYNRRYLGSKAKLIDFIHNVVSENCKDIKTMFDLFGGTGVVGYSFNKEYTIFINDLLTTNLVAYDTFFSYVPIDMDKIESIIQKYNLIKPDEDNYYSINFADTYLSKKNMKKVGYIRDDIDTLYKNKMINKREKSILICSLI